jgi:hypothetical protein
MRTVAFDHEILWLRESQSSWSISGPDGETISVGTSHTDFYGFLTSADQVIEAAKEASRKYACTKDGPLSVDVVMTVDERPVVASTADPFYVGDACYLAVPKDWAVAGPEADAWFSATGLSDRLALEPPYLRPAVARHTIWTSRNDGAGNRAALRQACELSLVGVPQEAAAAVRQRLAKTSETAA